MEKISDSGEALLSVQYIHLAIFCDNKKHWRYGPSSQNRINQSLFLVGRPDLLSLKIGLEIYISFVNALNYCAQIWLPRT